MPPAFSLTAQPIDAAALLARLRDPRAGGLAVFEGWVRNHHEGRAVAALEYEAYAPLALKEGARILDEARGRFAIYHAAAEHRVGRLAIGESAVWVGVSAAHREEAFDACRFIIDAIKARVPVWKKEYYSDGDSGWVNCERCAHAAHGQSLSHGAGEPGA